MPKRRSPDSLLTKLENMEINDQIFVKKSNGYVSDNICTIRKNFPTRRFTQTSVLTHEGLEFKTLADFVKMICITRIS